MTPEEFKAAEARAMVLLDLHAQIITYCVDHDMTCDELATLIAGLLVCTASEGQLGEALGNVIGKVLDYLPNKKSALVRLARVEPHGHA